MLDADSADFRVQQNAYINMADFRFGPTTDKGFTEQLESIGGTLLIANANLPATGTTYCIGVADDYANRREIIFLWNSGGNHGIYCYNYVYNRIDPVLLNSQVTGGLGFDNLHLIHSARVENGCVYWTDNLVQPRRVNIDAGLQMNGVFYMLVPNTNYLPVSNFDPLNGMYGPTYLVFTFAVPINPAPGYISTQIKYTVYAIGNDGFAATPSLVEMAWTPPEYPNKSPAQVFTDGMVAMLLTRDPSHTNWETYATGNTMSVYIKNTWDFGTGDGPFTPIKSLNVLVNNYVYPDGATPFPYVSPVSQSVIAWVRRQPGLPPTSQKIYQTSPAVVTNQIGTDAYEFCYRYTYANGELSTLSGYSTLQNFNATSDLFNRIDIQIPIGEIIDQDVIQVDIIARYLIGNIFFVIKSWMVSNNTDYVAITNHNNGFAALTYSFYNDVAGIALDAAYVEKEFDSLPLLAQAMEMAKQRAFFANYLMGYNVPTVTSLSFTTTTNTYSTGSTTSVLGTWFLLQYADIFQSFSDYIIGTTRRVFATDDLTGPTWYYRYSGTVPPYPGIIASSTLTFIGNTAVQAAQNMHIYHEGTPHIIGGAKLTSQSANSIINTGTVPATTLLGTGFKALSNYQIAINFRDFSGMACGAVTNSSLVLSTPDDFVDSSDISLVTAVDWTLSNANPLIEIPVWAYYYSINITLSLRTRFFVEGIGVTIYAGRDSENNYTFNTGTYASTLAGVAIDISGLQSYGQGYVFAQGDFVHLRIAQAFTLSVIGQFAQYIICQLANVGDLGTDGAIGIYEIYTPYQRAANEPFYEVGQIFPVTNPTTNSRQYSALSGSIGGDIYALNRGSYITEAMNINDQYYSNWFTSAGRQSLIDYLGQVNHYTTICFSDTFTPGSQNNGLSSFEADNEQDISPDFGPIQKLQLASKVGKVGTIMLAICSGPTTASIYLSENTLISDTGASTVGQSSAVIGSVHELKGGFGTLNPESVIEFRGNIYWFDVQNGMIIQYADNGLFPISNYKMNRYWKLFSDQYKSMTQEQIIALGSQPFVTAGVDPHHGEILFTVPKVLENPPNGTLPDIPEIIYPFDIWDGYPKTLVYKLYTDPNHWQGSYSFDPEYLFSLENNLYSLKNGQLYLHNQTGNYSQYYGTTHNPFVCGVSNQQPNAPKVYNNFSAEANLPPDLVYLYTNYPSPYTQASNLATTDFLYKENIYYAPMYRNVLDPQFGGQYAQALLAGEKMRSTALYWFVNYVGNRYIAVKYVNLGYTASLGQKV
jgi:hypothetical protein